MSLQKLNYCFLPQSKMNRILLLKFDVSSTSYILIDRVYQLTTSYIQPTTVCQVETVDFIRSLSRLRLVNSKSKPTRGESKFLIALSLFSELLLFESTWQERRRGVSGSCQCRLESRAGGMFLQSTNKIWIWFT